MGCSSFDALLACLQGKPPSDIEWDAVARESNNHLVVPSLHGALRGNPALPEGLESYLEFIHVSNVERNRRLRSQLLEALRGLNQAGIEPLLIKGAATLFAEPNEELASRMMADLDIVIDPPQLDEAMRVLAAMGYHVASFEEGAHAFATISRPCDVGTIDIHHRLPGPAALVNSLRLTQTTVSVQIADTRARLPSPEDRFALLLVHDMIHDHRLVKGTINIRHLIDFVAILHSNPSLTWQSLRRKYKGGKLLWAFDLCRLNAERLLGVPHQKGLPTSLVARVLYRRQILRLRNPRLKRADDLIGGLAHRIWLGSKSWAPGAS